MKKDLKKILVISFLVILQIGSCIPIYAQRMTEAIPKLKTLNQISTNQIEISYDMPVDLTKGETATNYWIQSVTEEIPSGIATLGKNDKVSTSNSLTADKVQIKAKDNEQTTFILTFSQPITPGKEYKLIICYVTIPGGAPYTGDNGSKVFIGK